MKANISNISVSWKSDKGRRSANEDSALALLGEEAGPGVDGLFVVADGMGGRASGAVASSTAVEAVKDAFRSAVGRSADLRTALASSLRSANDAVYRRGNSEPGLQGMGTTCVSAVISSGQVHLAHLGDSRAYLLRNGGLRQLTEDHSFVAEKVKTGEISEEQARKSRFRNVITKAVGLESSVQPDVAEFDLLPGDVILLCSDGLTVPVSDTEIADILCSSPDGEKVCDLLISAALRNGGSDNITTVIVTYGDQAKRSPAGAQAHKAKGRGSSWVLPSVVSLLLGAVLGLYPGQMLLSKVLPPAPETAMTRAVPQVDLSHVVYGKPEAMMYTPVQGSLLALDETNTLHLVDHSGQFVRIDTSGRVTKTEPARKSFARAASIQGGPMAATDVQSNVYVSDLPGKRVLKFAPNGTLIATIGAGQLEGPQALAVDRDGSIYVVDNGRLKAIRVKAQPVQTPADADEQ